MKPFATSTLAVLLLARSASGEVANNAGKLQEAVEEFHNALIESQDANNEAYLPVLSDESELLDIKEDIKTPLKKLNSSKQEDLEFSNKNDKYSGKPIH